jgi:hypothetical protein
VGEAAGQGGGGAECRGDAGPEAGAASALAEEGLPTFGPAMRSRDGRAAAVWGLPHAAIALPRLHELSQAVEGPGAVLTRASARPRARPATTGRNPRVRASVPDPERCPFRTLNADEEPVRTASTSGHRGLPRFGACCALVLGPFRARRGGARVQSGWTARFLVPRAHQRSLPAVLYTSF